ncbi:hypothetical protein Tco_0986577 [Tanacetum coccineum]
MWVSWMVMLAWRRCGGCCSCAAAGGDSMVMWMMVEGGVARLEWPEILPDNGWKLWEAPDYYRGEGGCISV